MKSYIAKQNAETESKPIMALNKQTHLSQEWHDQRDYQSINAGVPHNRAWCQEKDRRRAIMHRREGHVMTIFS